MSTRRGPARPGVVVPAAVTATGRTPDAPAPETVPAPQRLVVPGTPPDDQAPAPNRIRPNLLVVWFGGKDVPAKMDETPPQSPPVTLHVSDLERFYRRIRKRLAD